MKCGAMWRKARARTYKVEVNKIYNKDCMKGMQKMDDNSVDMVLTDVPYAVVNRDGGFRNMDKGAADIETFDMVEFITACNRVCSGSLYVFCSTEQVSVVRSTMVDLGLSTRLCIWEKTNPSPVNGQHMWLSSIECCVFGRKSKAVFNEHCKSPVWRFPIEPNQKHPTQKSLELFKYLVRVSSNMNDIILDPCMGSGTTALAALQQDRRFIGFEINKKYFEKATARIDMECRQVKIWEIGG